MAGTEKDAKTPNGIIGNERAVGRGGPRGHTDDRQTLWATQIGRAKDQRRSGPADRRQKKATNIRGKIGVVTRVWEVAHRIASSEV